MNYQVLIILTLLNEETRFSLDVFARTPELAEQEAYNRFAGYGAEYGVVSAYACRGESQEEIDMDDNSGELAREQLEREVAEEHKLINERNI